MTASHSQPSLCQPSEWPGQLAVCQDAGSGVGLGEGQEKVGVGHRFPPVSSLRWHQFLAPNLHSQDARVRGCGMGSAQVQGALPGGESATHREPSGGTRPAGWQRALSLLPRHCPWGPVSPWHCPFSPGPPACSEALFCPPTTLEGAAPGPRSPLWPPAQSFALRAHLARRCPSPAS